jgi:predicted metal-dependent hydrolase
MLTQQLDNLAWLPQYSIRISPKARRVILKVSMQKGLEIVLPRRYQVREAFTFIQAKKIWIEKNVNLLKAYKPASNLLILPDELNFRAYQENWKIHYISAIKPPTLLSRPGNELVIYGDIREIKSCQTLIKQWLHEKAFIFLGNHLQQLSKQYGFIYKKHTIRDQKTRWGSCSAKGHIHLNFRLIFLEPEVTRHILLHELCHTIHLNHSIRFWRLLAKYDENWQLHRQSSSRIENLIPAWLMNTKN